MRSTIAGSWRQVIVVALLIGVDVAVSLPIMGATYRPFSWMSIAPADAATLYPVIQELSYQGDKPRMSIAVTPGARCVLQRSTNLMDATGWTDVSTTNATNQVIFLIDSNPVSRAVFYRVTQILGESP